MGQGTARAGCAPGERAGAACGRQAQGRGLACQGAASWYPNLKSRARLVTVVGVSLQSGQQLADKSPVRRSRLRTPSQWLGSGSASVRSSMAQADTKANGGDEKQLSSEVEGLPTRLLTWCFPTRLFSQHPEPRPCSCAAPELALSMGD